MRMISTLALLLVTSLSWAGDATLRWTKPTQNEDGSTLTNLSGYRIYYGTSPTTLQAYADLNNPGLVSYIVTGLARGTWYFAITSLTPTAESKKSNVVSKIVRSPGPTDGAIERPTDGSIER